MNGLRRGLRILSAMSVSDPTTPPTGHVADETTPGAPTKPTATQAREAAQADWKATVDAMRAKTAGVDWRGVDWSQLRASDVGVQFGMPMTEEEFKEYRKRQGSNNVHVITPKQKSGTKKP